MVTKFHMSDDCWFEDNGRGHINLMYNERPYHPECSAPFGGNDHVTRIYIDENEANRIVEFLKDKFPKIR